MLRQGAAAKEIMPFGVLPRLVSGVWERMESWGIAGRGMYWRPLLQVDVAPGAERRFVELAALLEGSGMMVERK